jgi:hypothetical protein
MADLEKLPKYLKDDTSLLEAWQENMEVRIREDPNEILDTLIGYMSQKELQERVQDYKENFEGL